MKLQDSKMLLIVKKKKSVGIIWFLIEAEGLRVHKKKM